jgi:hypothetical protein
MCVTPPVNLHLLVTVEVSNNFQDFNVDGVTYTFEPAAVLFELQPSIGPIQDKNSITVFGTHFNNAPLFTCKLEQLLMPALVVTNSNAAICGVPPSSKAVCISLSACISLSSSNNDVNFTNNGLKYCYIGALEAISIQPSFGPQTGNTLRVLSHSMLSCSRPAQSSAYLAQVGAGVDQVSVTSTLYFHY